jgi:hypothetical protein
VGRKSVNRAKIFVELPENMLLGKLRYRGIQKSFKNKIKNDYNNMNQSFIN